MKLGKLTFRQYLALSLIYTQQKMYKRYPSLNEIKEAIGFGTDRMLKITLSALEKKGFIDYNNDSKIKIKEGVDNYSDLFYEPLILQDVKTINYEELIKKINNTEITEIKVRNSQIKIDQYLQIDNEQFIKNLNNEKEIFHRWSNYLQDFPPTLVWEKLKEFKINQGSIVLDPFAGSGTTMITSKMLGINSIGIDVNPVATFLTKSKTNWEVNVSDFKKTSEKLLSNLKTALKNLKNVKLRSDFLEDMGFIESHQWLKPKTQNAVAFVKESLKEMEQSSIKDLIKFAFVTAAVESSNVSFCPGTSFYPFRQRPEFYDAFLSKIKTMIEDLLLIQKGRIKYGDCTLYTEDCRKAPKFLEKEIVDFIITSPPYPNDLEYTRQTRLELFLLDYIRNLNDVQKIKRKMVKGSTKLIYKESNSASLVKDFESVQLIADKISQALNNKKWGWDYPRMVREYFGDIFLVLKEMKEVLKKNHFALFVVGDQTYKEILIPVGDILIEFAHYLEYNSASKEKFRIRNSTIHNIPLEEEIVILNH